MPLDPDAVRKVAHLARIHVPEEHLPDLTKELGEILSWVDQLSEVETSNIGVTSSLIENNLYVRDDVVTDGNMKASILENAPSTDGRFFQVPRVLD